MWRRKTSKGVSEQIIPMSRIFPNPALLLPQLARASFVKTMISLFSLLTEVSYLSLLVCSLVTSAEEKMCVLAGLGFLASFPKETGIMQLYLYVCAHACFKRFQSPLANFNSRVLLLKMFCLYRLCENQGPGRRDKPSLSRKV